MPTQTFVNFTSKDRARIIAGVAPSGSSKTKLRREKQAAEQSRKLREATRKAVLHAGGDLSAIDQELLSFMDKDVENV